MFRGLFSRYRVHYCAYIPGLTNNALDNPEGYKKPEPKNGVERVVALFHTDKRGELQKEVVSAIQITLGSGFCLALYGGLKHSKGAFENWLTINSTTRFRTAYDAKRALHDYIFLDFSKYFLIYGTKGLAFSAILMFTIIAVSAFRDKNGILEYTAGGLVAGSLMRIHYGLRGMISGGVIGSVVSTMIGSVAFITMKMANTSIDDVRKWQYDLRVARKDAWRQLEYRADEDAVSVSLRDYSARLTQPNQDDDDDDEEKVFVLVKPENESVTSDVIPRS